MFGYSSLADGFFFSHFHLVRDSKKSKVKSLKVPTMPSLDSILTFNYELMAGC